LRASGEQKSCRNPASLSEKLVRTKLQTLKKNAVKKPNGPVNGWTGQRFFTASTTSTPSNANAAAGSSSKKSSSTQALQKLSWIGTSSSAPGQAPSILTCCLGRTPPTSPWPGRTARNQPEALTAEMSQRTQSQSHPRLIKTSTTSKPKSPATTSTSRTRVH